MKDRTKKMVSGLAGGASLLLLILYMGGFFDTGLLGPEDGDPPGERVYRPEATARATVESITEWYKAVGTVRPRTVSRIEAQITDRILEIFVSAGDRVTEGQCLVKLDDRRLKSRLEQILQHLKSAKAGREEAVQGGRAAKARYKQVQSQYRRVKTYFQEEAATEKDLEEAESAYYQAKAGLQRSRDALERAEAVVVQAKKKVEEARITLGYSTILSPMEGEISERLADPGDMAMPGKPLLMIQTRRALRLEALVREGLIERIKPGTRFVVSIEALGKTTEANIEEVVPSADPRSRTFLVKAGLSYTPPDLYPGMFGRLLVPLGTREAVLVPRKALRQVGQLDMVTIKDKGRWKDVAVTTGKTFDHKIEIFSGLSGGEILAVPEA